MCAFIATNCIITESSVENLNCFQKQKVNHGSSLDFIATVGKSVLQIM